MQFNVARQKIHVETWERNAVYQFFKTFTEPFHSVCLRMDCTQTFDYAKQNRLSIFYSLMHRSLVASHLVENFRTRIVQGEPWLYEQINGGSAVGRPNGTIGFGHYRFHDRIQEFVPEASLEAERVRQRNDLERYPDMNLIRYSVLPWLDFTSLTHARDYAREDSAPRITFGKITESGGRRTLPVSIHVHHSLIDGLHVGLFVEHMQALLHEPERCPI